MLVQEQVILNDNFFDIILNYSEMLNIFIQESLNIYLKYYDLNYLKKALRSSYEDCVERIIVGNSYSLIGIEEQLFEEKTINLSMHSQDLYYSFELAKKAILNNKNIKQCILGMCYFTLQHDLSRGIAEYSRNMIKNVYYPLLNDIHNSNLENIENQKTLKRCKLDIYMNIFDIDKVEEYINAVIDSDIVLYYNRINNLNRKTSLNDFDIKYKDELGQDRASQHNKLFKYNGTEIEYRHILKQIKEEYNIKLIDLRNSTFEFNDEDFIDTDHLNENGSIKATEYLKKFI